MERGVNSIICKQRERLFDARKGSFHSEETPSSIEREPPLTLIPVVPANRTLLRQRLNISKNEASKQRETTELTPSI